MDFDFSDEQLMLQQMTRELLDQHSAPAVLRQLIDTSEGYRQDTWRQLADLGLLGVTIPEAYGGQELGMIELALVLEEMGRAALPSPYFATAVLASTALEIGGSEDQRHHYLGGIATGQTKATLALMEEGLAWDLEAVRLPAIADGDGWRLNGAKWLVPYAQAADLLLIAARDQASGGLSLFAIDRGTPGLSIEPLQTMDLTNRVDKVVLNEVRVSRQQLVGPAGGADAILERVLDRAAVGAAAEMLGAARRSLHMAVEYAKTREQFGQPIGTFQAVKHMCSEMLMEVEQSHAAVYYAAWAQSAGAADASLAASVAKAYVSGAARKVCGDAIQVHGGIGFTWDYDLHFYFKRAKHLEPLYGDADFHRERALQLAFNERAAASTAGNGERLAAAVAG